MSNFNNIVFILLKDIYILNNVHFLAFTVIKPATITKASDALAPISGEKIHEEPPKTSNIDENPDGEEIADDLSEISDEADDILAQQEVNIFEICIFLFFI